MVTKTIPGSDGRGRDSRSIRLPAAVLLAAVLALTGCGEGGSAGPENDVDLDLTKLSSTMVYSEVYNMVADPESFAGKTVRMKGTFDIFEDADDGSYGYSCVIADATACCAQGIPFVRDGDYHFPEDYPDIWSEITVEGTFEVAESGGYKIGRLENARLEVDQES